MDSARAATAKPEGGPAANEAPPAAASNGTTPNSANGANGANGNSANPNWWSPQEDKLFEKVLSENYGEKMEDVLEECARQIPTKDVEAVRRRFEQLEQDVNNIEAGRVPLPNYADSGSMAVGGSRKGGKGSGGKKEQHSERKKGIPWTEEEHRLFLLGLEKYGKGDWRSISRNFVVSRTPTQVASHAQKYFIRLSSINKRDKRRASIHDITSVDQADLASVHAARQASQEALAQAQAQAAGQQGKPMFGGGMVSMPPASYVSNMNMPQSGPQQYV